MKRKILVIGIGAGNPDHVTMQAADALNRADVFFIPNKGSEKQELAQLRRDICERFVKDRAYRMVEFDVPRRRDAGEGYGEAVSEWHDGVEAVYSRLLADEMGEHECGAFLVWGDPSLYDSTIRIIERIRAGGEIELDYTVIPGITAVQALAAQHRIPLNAIGQSVLITTGRRLPEAPDIETIVVMLDNGTALSEADPDSDIFWGAYLGTPDEILISGRLGDVAGEIARLRQEARGRHGWIMDTYLLRKRGRD